MSAGRRDAVLPGIALGIAGAAGALALRQLPALALVSSLMLAILLGMPVRNAGGTRAASAPEAAARPSMPWLVFGFLGMVAIASTTLVAARVLAPVALLAQALLAVALAAVGHETDLRSIAARGWRTRRLGAPTTVFISGTRLALVRLLA